MSRGNAINKIVSKILFEKFPVVGTIAVFKFG